MTPSAARTLAFRATLATPAASAGPSRWRAMGPVQNARPAGQRQDAHDVIGLRGFCPTNTIRIMWIMKLIQYVTRTNDEVRAGKNVPRRPMPSQRAFSCRPRERALSEGVLSFLATLVGSESGRSRHPATRRRTIARVSCDQSSSSLGTAALRIKRPLEMTVAWW